MARLPELRPHEGGASLMIAWRLAGRRVLVVGGGKVAAGRVQLALEADASVLVVAPQLGAALRARWTRGELDWRPAPWAPADLDGVDLVLACLDDEEVSATIAGEARARRIPVNCADHVPLCDFWLTSVHREGPVQLALSTGGQSPAGGARLLRELAARLPDRVGAAVAAFGELRQAVREVDPSPAASRRRMTWLGGLARTWSWGDLADLDPARVQALVSAYREGGPPPEASRTAPRSARGSRIRLVGAGPGDPRLLTIAAREALEEADLVLADRLVPPAILDLVAGELRVARKVPGRAQAAQDELDAWTLEAARAGRDVVRLKCGDPFVFGRGGEELAWLGHHGLEAEVIPGVSSALAAPLLAGIPTTMRGQADRLMVLTATGRHDTRPAPPTFDPHTTYVFLMGVQRLARLTEELQHAGFPADWPAAIVERASHPDQRSFRGTVATLPGIAARHGVAAPATLVIGQVVDALGSALAVEAAQQAVAV